MPRNLNGALLVIALVAATAPLPPALARGNDLIVNDGFGEQVTVKNGFFGRKTEIVKDRLGDGFATKTGLLGQKEQDVNILGNSLQRKKGILGGSDIKGSTIFGDRIETKKGILGRRTTYVDASGSANAIRTLWNQNKSKLLGSSVAGNAAGTMGGAPSKVGSQAFDGIGAPPVPNNGAIQPPSSPVQAPPSADF